MVDLGDRDAGVCKHVVERRAAAVEQILGHFLEVGAGERLVEVHRGPVRGHGQVLHVDRGGHRGGKLLLRLLGSFLQTLQGDLVLAQVNTVLVLHFADEPVDNALVPIVATEVVVARRSLHLDGGEAVVVLADLQQGDIEGAAAEIEDQNALVFLALLQTVGQSCSGRFVDDAQDVQACDCAGVLGRLALCIVEVCRAGDHGVRDRLAQVSFGVALQLHEDLCGNLLRSPFLAVDVNGPVGAHVALDGADRAIDVGHSLTLCNLADENLAGLAECHHRRCGACTFSVHDAGRFTALERCDAGIGGTQINTNCASHTVSPFVIHYSCYVPCSSPSSRPLLGDLS